MTEPRGAAAEPSAAFRRVVARLVGTAPERLLFSPLSGGVSSEIWRVDGDGNTWCAKRALPRLKVANDWFAPVSRNAEEVRWLRTARAWVGDAVAEVIAADEAAGVAVLAWYDPAVWYNWKSALLGGRIERGCGPALGRLLGTVARRSADAAGLADAFANHDLFEALRIEPFFRHLLPRHPMVRTLIDELTADRLCLVHGDFSPKNVLVSEAGGVRVLDAECACWGSPGFDPGYLLGHLLLKYLHRPDERLLDVAETFWDAYRREIGDRFGAFEPLVVRVVGGMLLARVDGKSPVEYLAPAAARAARHHGRRLLAEGPASVARLLAEWKHGDPDR